MIEPSAVQTLAPRLQAADIPHVTDPSLASLLRALVASTAGGVYLVSGEHLAPYAGWLLDGMDIGSRLIVNLPPHFDRNTVQPCFDIDLRVSGHVQSIAEFVVDVSRHRFALVALDCDGLPVDEDGAVFRQVNELVDAGGWLVLRNASVEQRDMLMRSSSAEQTSTQWCVSQFGQDDTIVLACRRAVPQNVRRGGRRARTRDRAAT